MSLLIVAVYFYTSIQSTVFRLNYSCVIAESWCNSKMPNFIHEKCVIVRSYSFQETYEITAVLGSV